MAEPLYSQLAQPYGIAMSDDKSFGFTVAYERKPACSAASPLACGNAKGERVYATPKPKTAADIQVWLVLYLANLLQVDPDEIDVTLPFDCYSLDSVGAIGLSGDIEQWLGCQCEPTLLYDYPTIEALTQYLANSLFNRKSSPQKTA